MNEKEFQAWIVEVARWNRYLVYHTYRSTRSQPGFPDLVLTRGQPPDLLFVECKSASGRLTREQQEWIDTLTAAGQDARVWRPTDADEVVARLARTKPRPRVDPLRDTPT